MFLMLFYSKLRFQKDKIYSSIDQIHGKTGLCGQQLLLHFDVLVFSLKLSC